MSTEQTAPRTRSYGLGGTRGALQSPGSTKKTQAGTLATLTQLSMLSTDVRHQAVHRFPPSHGIAAASMASASAFGQDLSLGEAEAPGA